MSIRQSFILAGRLMLSAVPDGLLARVLPGRLGWAPDAMQVAEAPRSDIRLLIGPANSAGQGYLWARAAEKHLVGVGAVSLMTTNDASARFGFPVDFGVPESGYVFARGWQRKQRDAIVNDFTHVLLESGRFVYGSVPGRTPLQIAAEIDRLGREVALLWHGSDIRMPSVHAASEPDSPFGAAGAYPAAATAVLEGNARERMRMITESDFPVFVSTPGLLDVPRARWLPVVVDPHAWRCVDPPLQRPVPVVAYVPSNSPMKGDPSIEVQLIELEEDGLISYRRLQGIPAREMPEVYRSADIVLDQFRLGDYGVAACEAMAAGRLVIGHVSDSVRELVRTRTGRELPIWESRFSDIGATVRAVLEDRDGARNFARQGPDFIDQVHDGAASADTLADFLGSRPNTSQEQQ